MHVCVIYYFFLQKNNVPKFKIKGKLTSSVLNITEPLTGEVINKLIGISYVNLVINFKFEFFICLTRIANSQWLRAVFLKIHT